MANAPKIIMRVEGKAGTKMTWKSKLKFKDCPGYAMRKLRARVDSTRRRDTLTCFSSSVHCAINIKYVQTK